MKYKLHELDCRGQDLPLGTTGPRLNCEKPILHIVALLNMRNMYLSVQMEKLRRRVPMTPRQCTLVQARLYFNFIFMLPIIDSA